MTKQRIVVKIGSSSLTNANGGLCLEMLREHVDALAKMKKEGHEVILISSGAVAAGFTNLGYPTRPVTIAGKQAAAAVGQGLLMQGYAEEFKKHGIVTAQLLLTRQSFAIQEQYNNAYSTLSELLKRDVLPIINENDSVSVDELTFGDNDMLSALVSGLVHANTLIILTDINGLYDDNPRSNPDAKKYDFLPEVTDELLAVAKGAGSAVGTGGMKSKIEAAKTALSVGVKVFIGKGSGENKLIEIAEGQGDGTYIGYENCPSMKNKKQWISIHSEIKGSITVDQGAEEAVLHKGKSLLPAGITSITGQFEPNDVVEIFNAQDELIGRGQVNFSSKDLNLIKGMSSQAALEKTNGQRKEVIHRDYWVTLKKVSSK